MLKGPFLNRNWMGSIDNIEQANIVLIGAPFDGTCSFTPGSRFAPERVRLQSWALEEYSPIFDIELENVKFFDAGDLEFPFGNTLKTLDVIKENAKQIFDMNKIYFGIGGEHLVTLPAVEACKNKYNDLYVLHFDAHTDLRTEYLGEKYSHATVMNHIGQLIGFDHLKQVGIRSGEKVEFDIMKKFNTLLSTPAELEILKGKNVFVSIDVDVLDPALMSGTGTQEAGGFTYRELLEWMKKFSLFNIVGADVVEIAPDIDPSGASLAIGTKLIRDMLMTIGVQHESIV